MRKRQWVVGFILWAMCTNVFAISLSAHVLNAAAAQGANASRTYIASQGILTQKKPIYSLTLKDNAGSTGYSWFLVSYPHDLLTLIKYQSFPPEKVAGKGQTMVGAPGKTVWEFAAKAPAFIAPRIIAVQFMYVQPWNIEKSNKGIKTFYIITRPEN
jgi:predicted secreted protein